MSSTGLLPLPGRLTSGPPPLRSRSEAGGRPSSAARLLVRRTRGRRPGSAGQRLPSLPRRRRRRGGGSAFVTGEASALDGVREQHIGEQRHREDKDQSLGTGVYIRSGPPVLHKVKGSWSSTKNHLNCALTRFAISSTIVDVDDEPRGGGKGPMD